MNIQYEIHGTNAFLGQEEMYHYTDYTERLLYM